MDVNAVGPDRLTIFQKFAGDQYRFKTVSHLIDMGADPDLRYPNGDTTMKVAKMMSHYQLVELLTARAEKRAKAGDTR